MLSLLRALPTVIWPGFICCILLWSPIEVSADDRAVEVRTREELIKAVNNAVPGTNILIASGEYRGGLHFRDLHGTVDKPIVLAALDESNPPMFKGGTSGIHLTSPQHVKLHNLILHDAAVNGLNIDDGGHENYPAVGIVLDGLRIRDVNSKGNHDGIKLSGVDDFKVEQCIVERWGQSGSAIDMVGCHDGEITGCHFTYRSDIFGSGVQTKGGSSNINIQRCRFENAGGRAVNIGGSTGKPYFRPRDAAFEAKNIIVEDCTFIGSMAPIVFVGVDGATVRHNTIYRPTRWIIRILQESKGNDFVPCRNGTFVSNLVVFRSDEMRTVLNVGGGTSPETFHFSNNHWYCIDAPDHSNRLSLPTTETGSTYGTAPKFHDVDNGDLKLTKDSPVQDQGVRH